MSLRIVMLMGFLLAASSCEFGEVEIPNGEPMVVAYAVMRPDVDRQWVLVEQTLTGATVSEDTASSVIPGDAPPVPIVGATVTIANLTFANDPCGDTPFTENAAVPGDRTSLGLYWGPPDCPAMRPGDTLALRVETTDGKIVTGRTEVVGSERMVLRTNTDSVMVPGPSLTLNRDIDTLEAEVSAEFGRSVQVEVARTDSAKLLDPVFLMFMDTTAITLPGNMVNFLDALFEDEDTTSNDSPESIFTAGRYHTVTVALMDDHFFDYMRTGNTPLSGRGFVNHLDGGMGVFGCVTAATNEVKVVSDLDDEREGGYTVAGTVQGVQVGIGLELYVAKAGEDTTDMAAFVQGDWVMGALDTSAKGTFRGGSMAMVIYQAHPLDPESVSTIVLSGEIGSGSSFTLDAYDQSLNRVGEVTVTRN